MNRSVAELSRRFARFSLHSLQRPVSFSSLSSAASVSSSRPDSVVFKKNLQFSNITTYNTSGAVCAVPTLDLPGLANPARIYTFPMFERPAIVDPAPFLDHLLEKMDPLPEKAPLQAPAQSPPVAIRLAPRLLTIRRKKMKKHKRRKRYDRDYFKYQKYHKEKKLRAEREFLQRMKGHLAELEAFDPQKYVNDTITMAKKQWSETLSPSGRRVYPHWSRFISLEELYGIPKSDYIDKKKECPFRAGLPTDEDKDKMAKLKEQYENLYRKA